MLDKTYRPAEIEAKFDRLWQEGGYLAPIDDPGARPYCIVIPPPNVTGSLHMGHALNNTIQDTLIRFHRMSGRAVLWQPGSDHAGIATQMVVERELAKEGIARRDLGRDKFVERVWTWKQRSGGLISQQLHRRRRRRRTSRENRCSKSVNERIWQRVFYAPPARRAVSRVQPGVVRQYYLPRRAENKVAWHFLDRRVDPSLQEGSFTRTVDREPTVGE